MPDILLTHGYFLFEDEKELEIMKPYPTLGLLYISAYLRRAGFDVAIFDSTFADRETLYACLHREPRGVLGLYTNLMTRVAVVQIMAEAKKSGWRVLVGGPEAGNYPEQYLNHGADAVVVGEGEATLVELLPALAKHGPHRLHSINGVVFRDDSGALVINPERSRIADIDSIPWPDRHLIDTQRYVDVWREHHGMGSVNLITVRGCPYRCKWCSHGVFGFSYRRRDPRDCVDEVAFIREAYRPDQVWYADDVFTINHRWLHSYAEELKRRAIRLPFETISRADRMMKEEVLETLAENGLLPDLDRLGERKPKGARRHAARRNGGAGRMGDEGRPASRHRGRHVPDVGLRRRDRGGHRGYHRARQTMQSRCLPHDRQLPDQGHRVLRPSCGPDSGRQGLGGVD